jgi:hypothetical protein
MRQDSPERNETIIDEFGDIDMPSILKNIMHQVINPSRDPSQLNDTIVSFLLNNVSAKITFSTFLFFHLT